MKDAFVSNPAIIIMIFAIGMLVPVFANDASTQSAEAAKPKSQAHDFSSLKGRWVGDIKQPNFGNYQIDISFDSNGRGLAEYIPLNCKTMLVPVNFQRGTYSFDEFPISADSTCVPGSIDIEFYGKKIHLKAYFKNGTFAADGRLTKFSASSSRKKTDLSSAYISKSEMPDCTAGAARQRPYSRERHKRFNKDWRELRGANLSTNAVTKIREAYRLIREAYAIYGFANEFSGNLYYAAAHMFQLQGKRAMQIDPLKCAAKIALAGNFENGTSMAIKAWHRLGNAYDRLDRFADAEKIYLRAINHAETKMGPRHYDLGIVLSGLGNIYSAAGLTVEAIRMYERAVPIYRDVFRDMPAEYTNDASLFASLLNNIARSRFIQGNYEEALRHSSISASLLAGYGYQLMHPYHRLAVMYRGYALSALGRHKEAMSIFKLLLGGAEQYRPKLVAISVQQLMTAHCLAGDEDSYFGLLDYYLTLDRTDKKKDEHEFHFIRSVCADRFGKQEDALKYIKLALKAYKAKGQSVRGPIEFVLSRPMQFFGVHHSFDEWLLALRLKDGLRPEVAAETFLAAQNRGSGASVSALEQFSSRSKKTSNGLDMRHVQDLIANKKRLDRNLAALLVQPKHNRDKGKENALRALQKDMARELEAVGFQPYQQGTPWALRQHYENVDDVRADLGTDEALVMFQTLPTNDGTKNSIVAWVLTSVEIIWWKIDLSPAQLDDAVAALRCGLDASNWIDATAWSEGTVDQMRRKRHQVARRKRCIALTGKDVSNAAPPPFDLARAHKLYQSLFGKIAGLIKGKHLLVVPSGPLTKLPFHVLVTEKPVMGGSYRDAQWLVRRNAITVLPSVASLKALRRVSRPSKASTPIIGFGNPLLTGPSGKDRRAFAKQTCPKVFAEKNSTNLAMVTGRNAPGIFTNFFRAGLADIQAIRHQYPLPETADELCAVAQTLQAKSKHIYLGATATETKIKQLNNDNALAHHRVVHFATHGLLAGETKLVAGSLAEPALILTPPDKATKQDDGLLTASEITQLKLDADWVVLSACNTAGGSDEANAEALSGLASAFFYAGARALLVSHWNVDSLATVKLITGAFEALKKDPGIGRAEALRSSVLAIMADRTRPKGWTPAAHPAVWAPFVVVGEGGAGR